MAERSFSEGYYENERTKPHCYMCRGKGYVTEQTDPGEYERVVCDCTVVAVDDEIDVGDDDA